MASLDLAKAAAAKRWHDELIAARKEAMQKSMAAAKPKKP